MNKNVSVILGNTNLGYSWFYKTYRQGLQYNNHDVIDIDYKSNSLAAIKEKLITISPEFCFTHLSFHAQVNPIPKVLQMYSDVHKKVGTRFIHTCNDARNEDRYMGDLRHAFSAAFVGSISMLQNCPPAWKIPVYYAPYSSLVYKHMAKPAPDLMFKEAVFTGSPASHNDRKSFIQRLGQRIPIRVFQTQSGEDLRHRTKELSVSAKCILGLCTGYDVLGYIDVRPWQYLGAGACMIMRKFPGMETLIPDEIYYKIESYGNDGVKEAVEHYNRILKEDTMEKQVLAFETIQKNHSCMVRLEYVLNKLKET
jgi:hypothetical protein